MIPRTCCTCWFIGGTSAILNLAVFLALLPHLSIVLAAGIAFYVGAALNYWLSTHILFRKNIKWNSWAEQLVYYTAVTGVAIVDVTLTKTLISIGLTAAWAKITASGTGLLLNFLARKYLVFPGKKIRDWK